MISEKGNGAQVVEMKQYVFFFFNVWLSSADRRIYDIYIFI